MTKLEIEESLRVLMMVTGDCPYEREIDREEDFNCDDIDTDCVVCWINALNKQLKNIKGEK